MRLIFGFVVFVVVRLDLGFVVLGVGGFSSSCRLILTRFCLCWFSSLGSFGIMRFGFCRFIIFGISRLSSSCWFILGCFIVCGLGLCFRIMWLRLDFGLLFWLWFSSSFWFWFRFGGFRILGFGFCRLSLWSPGILCFTNFCPNWCYFRIICWFDLSDLRILRLDFSWFVFRTFGIKRLNLSWFIF